PPRPPPARPATRPCGRRRAAASARSRGTRAGSPRRLSAGPASTVVRGRGPPRSCGLTGRGRRASGGPELLAQLPGVEDEQVRADEEEDQSDDRERQVAGELGREDVADPGVARRGSLDEAAEEQRREADADRCVSPEQRDRDPDEADLRDLDVEDAEPEQP